MAKTHHYQPAGDVTVTTTGNLDNLDVEGCALLLMANATLATIRGIKAGYPGQRLTIASIGAGQVNLAHQDAGSAAANRLINFATSGKTPLAPGVGTATCEYDSVAARWRLVTHDQGAGISPAYDAANFFAAGAMTWDVASGDVSTFVYFLKDRLLTVTWYLLSTTVGGTPATALKIKIPGGFTAARRKMNHHTYEDNAGPDTVAQAFTEAGSTAIELYKAGFGTVSWSLSTNLTTSYGQIVIEVQ